MNSKVKHDLKNTIIRLQSIIDFIDSEDDSFPIDELITDGNKALEKMDENWNHFISTRKSNVKDRDE